MLMLIAFLILIHFVLSCCVLFLSGPVLSCLSLSYPVLSCLVLSCLVLSCLFLCCPVFSFLILSVFSYIILWVGWRVCDTSSHQITEVKHTSPQPVTGLVSRLVFMGSIPVLHNNLWCQKHLKPTSG